MATIAGILGSGGDHDGDNTANGEHLLEAAIELIGECDRNQKRKAERKTDN